MILCDSNKMMKEAGVSQKNLSRDCVTQLDDWCKKNKTNYLIFREPNFIVSRHCTYNLVLTYYCI